MLVPVILQIVSTPGVTVIILVDSGMFAFRNSPMLTLLANGYDSGLILPRSVPDSEIEKWLYLSILIT